jgi:hypothetical protein
VGKIRFVRHVLRARHVRLHLLRRRIKKQMSLREILDLIRGVIQFPAALLKLIHVLRKTPQENHEDLLKRVGDESKKFEDTGRPTW